MQCQRTFCILPLLHVCRSIKCHTIVSSRSTPVHLASRMPHGFASVGAGALRSTASWKPNRAASSVLVHLVQAQKFSRSGSSLTMLQTTKLNVMHPWQRTRTCKVRTVCMLFCDAMEYSPYCLARKHPSLPSQNTPIAHLPILS